jgi:hypothetical protein
MSLPRDERSPKFILTKETCHAAPARGYHTGLSAVRTPVFSPCLAPGPRVTAGGAADTWRPHGDGGLAGDGAGDGAPLHERPPGPHPSPLVGPPGQSDAVRFAEGPVGPPQSDDGRRGRRPPRAPIRTPDHGERRRPGRGARLEHTRQPVLWADMGRDEARGAGALASARVGPRSRPRDDGTRPASTGCGRG